MIRRAGRFVASYIEEFAANHPGFIIPFIFGFLFAGCLAGTIVLVCL